MQKVTPERKFGVLASILTKITVSQSVSLHGSLAYRIDHGTWKINVQNH